MILFILFLWAILYYVSVLIVNSAYILSDILLFKKINVGELDTIIVENIKSIKTDGDEKVYIYLTEGDNVMVVYDIPLVKDITKDFLHNSLKKNKSIKLYKENVVYRTLYVIIMFILLSVMVFLLLRKYVRFELSGPSQSSVQNPSQKKSSGLILPENIKNTKIDDIGGLFDTKKDVLEFANMIYNPVKYKSLGVKMPSGVLFTGPPGTGKTMLARAIANEYNINFFYVSGSDFSSPFVGVSQLYVKELFNNARKSKPSILFIDEIDSIASARGTDNTKTSQENSSILNSLLVEMDGFSSDNEGFMVMGATNRVEILDKAILRPGRFDRIVHFGIPSIEERSDIINKYLKRLKFMKNKKSILDYILSETVGFTGAEISNIINESCIRTANLNKNLVDIDDVRYACDYVLYGREKKHDYMDLKEKELTAYHESGHALMGMILDESPEVIRVTIVPRENGSLGFTKFDQLENKRYNTKGELICDIMINMGGRVAEELKYDKFGITGGAYMDIQFMNKTAENIISRYGMNDNIGLSNINTLGNDRIEVEKQILLKKCYELTRSLILKNMTVLEKLKTDLLKNNNLEKDYFRKIKVSKIKDVSLLFEEKKSNVL